jgi:predicted metalloprotease with PDZ domain
MLDIKIRQASNQQFSLDDVMRSLDQHFGQTGLGYRKENLIELIKNCGYTEVETHFDSFIEGCDDYTDELRKCLNFVGLQLTAKRYFSEFEHRFGLLIQLVADGLMIKNVAPESPAYFAQLIPGDKILSINGVKNFDLSTSIQHSECLIERNNRIFGVNLKSLSAVFFDGYEITKNNAATPEMKEAFTLWTKQTFE